MSENDFFFAGVEVLWKWLLCCGCGEGRVEGSDVEGQ